MKNMILFLTVIGTMIASGFCEANQVTCSRDMRAAYETLIQLPEARQVVQNALKRGPIRVVSSYRDSDGFEGMWDAGSREIVVSPYANRTRGQKINTMMMEFHNAQTDERLGELFRGAHEGRLSKEYYVEQVERVEHQNALNSARLLAKGIQKGIYPHDAAWSVMEDFEDHYKIQQIMNHSLWIANNYDYINRYGQRQAYRGTVPNLHRLTPKEKSILCRYIHLNSELKSGNREVRERAQERFARELTRRRQGGSNACCRSHSAEAKCFEAIFGNVNQ